MLIPEGVLTTIKLNKMKQHILPAIRLSIFCLVFFCGAYTLVILGVAQAAPNKGQGETITVNNKIVGYKSEGQSFTNDNYFNGRSMDVYIAKLRKYLKADDSIELINIHGKGFKILNKK